MHFALSPLPSPAAQPPASPSPRPNILFAIADDWSYPHASAYNCKWVNTPAFDRVARTGLLFTHAYTPNAKCAPSRACILTGRNSWQLEEAANHMSFFPPRFRSFVEALESHGYFAAYTAKGWGPGIARTADGRPRNLTGQPFNARRLAPPTTGITPIDYAANFADFLAAAPPNTPWFFWYGALEPHRSYEFGSGVAKGGKSTSQIDRVPAYWPDNDTVRNDVLDYAYEVENFDRHLLRMLNLLEARGQLDNTLVIVTSDHGMPFPRVKGQEYEFSNHVPLAIRWPASIRSPGRTLDDFVSFIDLAPTILQAAAIPWDQSGLAPSPGRSLRELFDSDRSGHIVPARDHVLIGKERHDVGRPDDVGYPIRGIIEGNTLYLHNFEPSRWPAGNPETGYLNCDGSPTKTFILQSRRKTGHDPYWDLCFARRPADELYNFQHDPDCIHNLAQDPSHQPTLQRLRDKMTAELRAQHDPRILGQGEIFDRYPCSDPNTRNFYQRYLSGHRPRAPWVNDSDFELHPLD